jgi:hypothetical protein
LSEHDETSLTNNNEIDDVLSAGSSQGSFSDLQTTINGARAGSTVSLDKDYKSTQSSAIPIDKSLTIDGKGHTLDCDGKCGAFESKSGYITLKNLIIKNGDKSKGGAIFISGSARYTLINCTFINNSASMSGGAVSIVNASVNIANSTFENNTCNGSGAAVFIENATEVSIDHCDFVNCVAGDGSGSIKTDDAELLDVFNCVFDVIPEGIPVYYDSILVADDVSFAIDSNGILVVSLSDVRGPLVGKIITLTVNGNDYDNTTDSNGLARFNMKNYFSSVGNYSVSVSFAGDGNDGPNSTNVNVSIFNYKGILSITSSGKYYNDVNVSFRLYDMNTDLKVHSSFDDNIISRFNEPSLNVPFLAKENKRISCECYKNGDIAIVEYYDRITVSRTYIIKDMLFDSQLNDPSYIETAAKSLADQDKEGDREYIPEEFLKHKN